MKLYVLDENGHILFEFDQVSGGLKFDQSSVVKLKIVTLLWAALRWL
jgi:hypothetical protein